MILHVFVLAHTLYYYYPAAANRLAKKSLGRPTGCAREEQAEAAVPSVPISDNLQAKYLLDLSVRWHRLGHVLLRRHAPPDAAAM